MKQGDEASSKVYAVAYNSEIEIKSESKRPKERAHGRPSGHVALQLAYIREDWTIITSRVGIILQVRKVVGRPHHVAEGGEKVRDCQKRDDTPRPRPQVPPSRVDVHDQQGANAGERAGDNRNDRWSLSKGEGSEISSAFVPVDRTTV